MMPRENRVRSRRSVSKVRRYWWLTPVLALVVFVLWLATGPEWSRPRTGRPTDLTLPPGYVAAFSTVFQEYQRFYGKALQDKELNGRFDNATRYMTQHDYGRAAQVLEEVAGAAAVPAVFNDLGLVYLAQNDRGRAVNAFREALSRDIDYQQVRQNLDRLKEIGFENATPLTHEAEANNTILMANIIAPSKPVEGEIMAAVNDIDCFKVVAPQAPRDTLLIEVVPQSRMLEPMLNVYDSERRMLQSAKGKDAPGKPVSVKLAPPPNSTLFLEVSGMHESAGLYTVKVTPQKSFDAHEPNDDISNARPIPLKTAIQANIMDRFDTDYYSFEPTRAGKVKITIQNKSASLIPVLTTFTPDMRSSGFGANARGPAGSLEYSLAVEANQRYFIQVSSQGDTAGDYVLTIEE